MLVLPNEVKDLLFCSKAKKSFLLKQKTIIIREKSKQRNKEEDKRYRKTKSSEDWGQHSGQEIEL